jgi:hypothetical protein
LWRWWGAADIFDIGAGRIVTVIAQGAPFGVMTAKDDIDDMPIAGTKARC